ncbi:hypothetical protein BDN72DRAFT_828853 [Pluteus cervinus]|uniref:Uncharacterized protein n=1 Tax=Pluteus cervinus TaxID=181527 RepID=A0ACD3A4F1_9AGAR|nr:hypothetical protein BDN72DRAFT_828853 [Pluteus cervinus]
MSNPWADMPPAIDPSILPATGAFIPPPPGASFGGQPSGYYPSFPQQQQPQPSSSTAWPNLQPTTNPAMMTAGVGQQGNWSNPPRPASAHPYTYYPSQQQVQQAQQQQGYPQQPPPPSTTPAPQTAPPASTGWAYAGYPPATPPNQSWSGQTAHSAGSASTPGSASWGVPTPAGSWGPLTPTSVNQPNSPFVQVNQAAYPMVAIAGQDSSFTSNGHNGIASTSPGPGAWGNGTNQAAAMTLAGWGTAGMTGMEPKKKKKKKKDYPQAYMPFQTSLMPMAVTDPNQQQHQQQQQQQLLQAQYPTQTYPTLRPPSQVPNGYPPSRAASAMGYTTPSYAQPDVYTARNLAKRPLDWRADYEPKSRASYLPRVTKNRSEVKEYSDSVRRTLHPLLLHTTPPPIHLDLRDNPLEPGALEFPNLQRLHNDLDFAQLATTPSVPTLRLYHPRLPWYIDVHQTHCNGVTVFDILTQTFAQLMVQIQGRHYWNDVLDDEDRTKIVEAYSVRCEGDQDEIGHGVLQVDFLGNKVIFEGLARGRNGMWEIKTRKEEYSG